MILVLFFLGKIIWCSHLQQVKDDVRAPAEYEDEYDDEGHLDRLDLGLGDEAAGGRAAALGGGRGGGRGRGGHRACAVVAARVAAEAAGPAAEEGGHAAAHSGGGMEAPKNAFF